GGSDPGGSRHELSWTGRARTDPVVGQDDRRLPRVLVHGSSPVHFSRTDDCPSGVVIQLHWRRSEGEAGSATAKSLIFSRHADLRRPDYYPLFMSESSHCWRNASLFTT